MKNTKNNQLRESKGITLIALVITIIVLLILAGVTIVALSGDNGILQNAIRAKELTEVKSEEEAIKLIVTAVNSETKKENSEYYTGVELYDRTIENGNKWHILTNKNTNETYGNGWNYIKVGEEIQDYGETKYSWVVNYESGEVKQIEENEYTELYYGMNLAIKEGLLLNVDPINMENENSWGNGVTLKGVQEGDGYGYNGDAILFDGVDDYIEIYADTPISEGLTFEFYGKSNDSSINMLSKTIKGDGGYGDRFRCVYWNNVGFFQACFSGKNSESDWAVEDIERGHWIRKSLNYDFNSEQGGYITMTVNLETNTISVYLNGEYVDSTTCSHEWLISGQLVDKDVPFTIGLCVSGDRYEEHYSKMELYACRLYNKVLTNEEISDNYEKTTSYRNQT